jgi:hypothetical protein
VEGFLPYTLSSSSSPKKKLDEPWPGPSANSAGYQFYGALAKKTSQITALFTAVLYPCRKDVNSSLKQQKSLFQGK